MDILQIIEAIRPLIDEVPGTQEQRLAKVLTASALVLGANAKQIVIAADACCQSMGALERAMQPGGQPRGPSSIQ